MVNDSANLTSNKAIVDMLQRFLNRTYKLIEKHEIKIGHLKMFVNPVRRQLIKLYGEESQIIKNFTPIKGEVAPDLIENILRHRMAVIESFIDELNALGHRQLGAGGNVFLGHGRSLLWRELRDFLQLRLSLPCAEFNSESVAGITTTQRLHELLGNASFAFLIMTAEDEHKNESLHARENVIHEIGLFQGYLGARKAIILLEDGCEEFSNIIGLSQIRFPKGNISAAYEEIRLVLEREGIIDG